MENLLIIFKNPFYMDIHFSVLCNFIMSWCGLLSQFYLEFIGLLGYLYSSDLFSATTSSIILALPLSLSLSWDSVCLLACLMVFHRTLAHVHFSSIFGLFLKFDNFHCPMLSDSFFCILKSPWVISLYSVSVIVLFSSRNIFYLLILPFYSTLFCFYFLHICC